MTVVVWLNTKTHEPGKASHGRKIYFYPPINDAAQDLTLLGPRLRYAKA